MLQRIRKAFMEFRYYTLPRLWDRVTGNTEPHPTEADLKDMEQWGKWGEEKEKP